MLAGFPSSRVVVTIALIATGFVVPSVRAQTIVDQWASVQVPPADGISADIPYAEQYTLWHPTNAPRISDAVTLTTIDDLHF